MIYVIKINYFIVISVDEFLLRSVRIHQLTICLTIFINKTNLDLK